MEYKQLFEGLKNINKTFSLAAKKAVNINLSVRNWLFGYYIVEFEQNGKDRAKYGQQLLKKLSDELNIKGLPQAELSRCRQFYKTYPEIFGSVTQEFKEVKKILGSVTQKLQNENNPVENIIKISELQKGDIDLSYQLTLLKSTSYTHFAELIKISDPTKRKFYELLLLKTTPSVRELKRQIETLTYERLGLSSDKPLAMEQLVNKIEPEQGTDLIKSHYFFDFLHINHPELIEETELEQALIDHLQEFILELGNGFCFEARQKRILIGDEYYYIDIVFYHRVLKCHVLIELKTVYAKHENIGQLKSYIEHYKKKIKLENDNPPVGILLVTGQNKTLVEYAIAESDKEIFVSEYLLQLPSKKQLQEFIDNELKTYKNE